MLDDPTRPRDYVVLPAHPLVVRYVASHPEAAAHAGVDIMHVARKMEEFPHIFEIAKARNELDNYDLSGVYREGGKHAFTHVSFQNWTVPVREVESFIRSGSLTPAMATRSPLDF